MMYKVNTLIMRTKSGIANAMFAKKKGATEIIVAAVLLLIAVILLAIFRQQIIAWFTSIMSSISGEVNSLTTDPSITITPAP